MGSGKVARALLPWWLGGLLLGLTQVAAIGIKKPLGASTQFVVADTQALNAVAPDYAKGHDLIGGDKYQKPGYGWWLVIGLAAGAFAASVLTLSWRPRVTSVWWAANGRGVAARFLACLVGGFLLLFGSRLAHGCTSGQFASGWAQLSLAAVPFTVALFGGGMIAAFFFHRKSPEIE